MSTSREFPGFSRLYKLEEPGVSRAFRATMKSMGDLDFALTRGEYRPDKPLRFHWMMGRRVPTDVIQTDLVAPVLFVDRVIALLEANRFTGDRMLAQQLVLNAEFLIELPFTRKEHTEVAIFRVQADHNLEAVTQPQLETVGIRVWSRGNLRYDC